MAGREERITEILNSLKHVKGKGKSEADALLKDAIQDVTDELVEEAKETGAGLGDLLSQWTEVFPAEKFWREVGKRAENDLQPYREAAFLRKLPDKRWRELLTEAFEQGIRYHEHADYLSGQLEVTEAQLKTVLKMYNTLIHWVIIDRMSRRCFFQQCKDYFGFSEEVMGFLWELLENGRPMLVERFLVKNVSEYQDTLQRLVKILMEAFSDEGDEDGSGDE